eukprot:gene37102-45036_t
MSSIPSDQALLQAFARQKSAKVLVVGETPQGSSATANSATSRNSNLTANSNLNIASTSNGSIENSVSSPRPSLAPIVTDRALLQNFASPNNPLKAKTPVRSSSINLGSSTPAATPRATAQGNESPRATDALSNEPAESIESILLKAFTPLQSDVAAMQTLRSRQLQHEDSGDSQDMRASDGSVIFRIPTPPLPGSLVDIENNSRNMSKSNSFIKESITTSISKTNSFVKDSVEDEKDKEKEKGRVSIQTTPVTSRPASPPSNPSPATILHTPNPSSAQPSPSPAAHASLSPSSHPSPVQASQPTASPVVAHTHTHPAHPPAQVPRWQVDAQLVLHSLILIGFDSDLYVDLYRGIAYDLPPPSIEVFEHSNGEKMLLTILHYLLSILDPSFPPTITHVFPYTTGMEKLKFRQEVVSALQRLAGKGLLPHRLASASVLALGRDAKAMSFSSSGDRSGSHAAAEARGWRTDVWGLLRGRPTLGESAFVE